jgi:hypothetical protein
MIECFVSCCLPDYPVFRCELGWLLEHEIEFFERKSNIENNPDYVFHKGIVLDTLDKEYEHKKALETFDDYCIKRKSYGHEYCFFPDDLVPYIDRMEEFITLAEDIIELRKTETASVDDPLVFNDEQKDILDLIDETEDLWVSQADFLNTNINVNAGCFTARDLQKRKTIQWSIKNPLIGMYTNGDTKGVFTRSNGAETEGARRYEYWLLKEHDKRNGE